jgi:chorismate mutase
MRIVRFARAVGQIERGAGISHKSFPERRISRRLRRQKGSQRGVNRPLWHGVNVFFDFGLNGTYQSPAPPDLIAGLGRRTWTMPKPPRHKDVSLADLRREIDRIDEAMHALLLERSEIIDTLIAVKKTEETGSAFRPAREADMMRRLVARHRGTLPLETAESIWRVIISTFTYVQAPFAVHADLSAGDALMRDSARFHFGFTVPFVPHIGASSVVEAVTESKGDLGLIPAFAVAGSGPWWTALEFATAPKIIARLPFVERANHPAALPVFVVSRVAADAMVTETEVWSMRVSGWSAAAVNTVAALADVIAVPDRAFDGAALLVSVERGGIGAVADALVKIGASIRSSALVGSHATRYTMP